MEEKRGRLGGRGRERERERERERDCKWYQFGKYLHSTKIQETQKKKKNQITIKIKAC